MKAAQRPEHREHCLFNSYGRSRHENDYGPSRHANENHNEPQRQHGQAGKVGWALLWLLGIPLPILILLYLIRG